MDLFRSGLRLLSASFPKSNELFKNSDGIPIDFLKNSNQMTSDFCCNSPRTLQENSSSTNWIFSLQRSISKLIFAGYKSSKNQVRRTRFSKFTFQKSSADQQGDREELFKLHILKYGPWNLEEHQFSKLEVKGKQFHLVLRWYRHCRCYRYCCLVYSLQSLMLDKVIQNANQISQRLFVNFWSGKCSLRYVRI